AAPFLALFSAHLPDLPARGDASGGAGEDGGVGIGGLAGRPRGEEFPQRAEDRGHRVDIGDRSGASSANHSESNRPARPLGKLSAVLRQARGPAAGSNRARPAGESGRGRASGASRSRGGSGEGIASPGAPGGMRAPGSRRSP